MDILRKPGPLTQAEWLEVKKHPVVGSDLILAISPSLARWRRRFRAHHERWDGSGFPEGADGLDIPLFGRIVSEGTSLTPSRTGADTGPASSRVRKESNSSQSVGVATSTRKS